MKFIPYLIVFLAFAAPANAQISKILHQTFELGTAQEIQLQLIGEYEIEKWAGNTILTETKVELYDASPGIFNHFVEKGRYEIEIDNAETHIQLNSKDQERKSIRTKKGECFEIVKLKIFVPDNFEIVDQTKLVIQAESEVSANEK